MTDPTQRQRYVRYLYGISAGTKAADKGRAAESRRLMARLRHSLLEGRQIQAYGVVFRDHLPDSTAEQELWLLLGGLFALHPKQWEGAGPRSIGASMGRLEKKRPGAAERRFTHLLGRDRQTLPHHLRQVVRLLGAHDIPVDYDILLDDLGILLSDQHRGQRATQVRLKWARDFHMPMTATQTSGSDKSPTDPPETTQ